MPRKTPRRNLTSATLLDVAIVEKTGTTQPTMAGWLPAEYPDDSETEEFKLADAFAWLAVNAPGCGRLSAADVTLNEAGKVVSIFQA